MKRPYAFFVALTAVTALSMNFSVLAQQRPAGLFLRETLKITPSCLSKPAAKVVSEVHGSYLQGNDAIPLTPDCLKNTNLEMKLYGKGKGELELVQLHSPPIYIWSGIVHSGNWVVTFKDKNNYVDLSAPGAKIRWRIKEAGFHLLRPVLKLADGTFLVGDHTDGYSIDWKESEFPVGNVHWRGLDGDKAVEAPDGKIKDHVDLSKVDEIGFTDLAIGAGHGAGGSTRLNWIEVYGNPVKRARPKN